MMNSTMVVQTATPASGIPDAATALDDLRRLYRLYKERRAHEGTTHLLVRALPTDDGTSWRAEITHHALREATGHERAEELIPATRLHAWAIHTAAAHLAAAAADRLLACLEIQYIERHDRAGTDPIRLRMATPSIGGLAYPGGDTLDHLPALAAAIAGFDAPLATLGNRLGRGDRWLVSTACDLALGSSSEHWTIHAADREAAIALAKARHLAVILADRGAGALGGHLTAHAMIHVTKAHRLIGR